MTEKVFKHGIKPGNITIGIDQSLTGFAITAMNVDAPDCYETWVFKSSYHGVRRLADIRWWMEKKFDDLDKAGCRTVEIAMEGLAGMVKLTLWTYFDGDINSVIPYPEHLRRPLQIPPMTLKKYATGKGNAKKQEMLMQMYKRWGVEFNNDNAADSYALARLASGSITGAIEAQIVEQIKDPKYRDSE
jgi:hypothetical protein